MDKQINPPHEDSKEAAQTPKTSGCTCHADHPAEARNVVGWRSRDQHTASFKHSRVNAPVYSAINNMHLRSAAGSGGAARWQTWVDGTFPEPLCQRQLETWTSCSYTSGADSWGKLLKISCTERYDPIRRECSDFSPLPSYFVRCSINSQLLNTKWTRCPTLTRPSASGWAKMKRYLLLPSTPSAPPCGATYRETK